MDCYTLVVRSPKIRHAFKEAEEREIKTKKEKKQQRSGTEGLQGGQWQAVPRGTRRPGQTRADPAQAAQAPPSRGTVFSPSPESLEGKENMFNQRYRTERAAGTSSSGRKCARRLVLPLKEIKFMVCQISRKENPQDGNPAR